jgi:hypothetical protein
MPNANYLKGVVLEREIVNLFKSVGCTAARTAGSHGHYDLYAVGTVGKIDLAKTKLEIEGFRPSKEGYTRKGRTYLDVLHVMIIGDGTDEAIFIQCKRKGA